MGLLLLRLSLKHHFSEIELVNTVFSYSNNNELYTSEIFYI